MRLAIIDCGTNTFNILVVDTQKEGKYSRVYNTRVSVKLGEGSINKGFIATGPFKRGIEALVLFNGIIEDHKVTRVLAFATSAIRDAANRKEFVEEAFEKTGIGINVINGDKEAELIYLGNKEAIELNNSISLIMDIGGGSTEFILANKEQIFWKKSFNLGAARLLEKFDPSNPITSAEVNLIYNYLSQNLSPVMEAVKTFPAVELVGSSGAFDSVVEMIHGELNGEPLLDNKTGYTIDIDNYHKISNLVKCSTLDQRKKINGLTPIRFDMIVISCLLIDFTLRSFKIDKMRVSTFSLKEGAIADFLKRELNLEKHQ